MNARVAHRAVPLAAPTQAREAPGRWVPTVAPAGVLSEAVALPVHVVDGAVLDHLELVLGGAPAPVPAGLPAARAAEGRAAGGLLLADPDGTPLARATVADESDTLRGPLVPLQPPEHGPFRRWRMPADQVRAECAGDDDLVAAVLRDVPSQAAVDHVRFAAAQSPGVVVMALVGAGSPRGVDVYGLVRACRALADSVGVPFVAVPWSVDAAGLGGGEDPRSEQFDDLGWLGDPSLGRALAAFGVTSVLDLPDGPVQPEEALPDTSARELHLANPAPIEQGAVVLLSGLSGSGKSTVARALADRLHEEGARRVTLLDGDDVRRMLSSGLGFGREDRILNVRRIGYVASLISAHGGLVICAPIAPYEQTRAEVRAMAEASGRFVLVHVSTPLAVCEARDRKGLYAKARAGLIPEFTGISDPYDVPIDADLAVDTSTVDLDTAVETVHSHLRSLGLLPAKGS